MVASCYIARGWRVVGAKAEWMYFKNEESARLWASGVHRAVESTSASLPELTLGAVLRKRRLQRKMSLRKLGASLKPNVSAPFLHDVEKGQRFPSKQVREALASALDLDPHELWGCDPRPPLEELQDMSIINPKFAFALRRIVHLLHAELITPEELVRRVEQPS